MMPSEPLPRPLTRRFAVPTCTFAILFLFTGIAPGQQKPDVLQIGSSGTLASTEASREKGALESLRSFIKDETGFTNEIHRQKNWQQLADRMAKNQLQIGVFQGYEFAWAQAKYPKLKPLALAINVYKYPVAYVVTRRDDAAKDFAGLAGQSLTLAHSTPEFVQFYLERQCQASGKKLNRFFSKVATPDDAEDAIDDVVDRVSQVTAADRATLEAYKQRKPGRFNQLKEVAQSPHFPPPVVAYYEGTLDQATLHRFEDGLLRAGHTDRGRTMLTLFRLTGFVRVPADFGQVLAQIRRDYPATDSTTK
jgi:ABC-type phosphate/phosphonate transport system substrate-binding protein